MMQAYLSYLKKLYSTLQTAATMLLKRINLHHFQKVHHQFAYRNYFKIFIGSATEI